MKSKSRRLSMVVAGAMLLFTVAGCGAKGDDAQIVSELKKEYRPLVKLAEYKGVSYEPTDTTVTDEDVQYQLDNLVSQNSTTEQIMTGTATWGDAVNIDYTGYINDEAFEGGDTQGKGTVITLGSSGYIDNFDEQIVGHKPGDSFDVNVTFPDDYGSTELAGKPAVFKTTLNYIEGEQITPTVDDSFIASATDGEYSTIEDYKKGTKEQLEKDKTENGLSTDKRAILQKVIDETTIVEYPEQEIQDRIDTVIAQYEDYAASNGVDLDTLLGYYFGYDEETFRSTIKTAVESFIREKMVVVAIADAENITVSEEEYNAKVQELLEQTGFNDVSQLNAQLGYTDEDYYFTVLEEKIMDLLYENAVASPGDAAAE